MVNITNRSAGRQGLNVGDARVWIAPGKTVDVQDERAIERAKRIPGLEIEGFSRSPTIRERSSGAPEPERTEDGPLQQQLDDLTASFEQQSLEFGTVQTQLGERNTRVEELEGQLKTANEELESLRSLEAGFLEKMTTVMTSASSPLAGKSLAGLNATHKGRGSYSVVNGDGEEIVEKLTKDQTDVFNAMTPVDQLVWIDSQLTMPKQAEPTEE